MHGQKVSRAALKLVQSKHPLEVNGFYYIFFAVVDSIAVLVNSKLVGSDWPFATSFQKKMVHYLIKKILK